MRVRAMLMTFAVVCLSWVVPANAFAVVVGDWQMDEVDTRPNAPVVMTDSSGNGFDGHIGNDVVLHESVSGGGYAYRFLGDWRIVNDERLVDWPDEGAALDQFDPGTQPFAVTIRLKTGALDPNIIQKGQANQAGGYWKFVLKKGWPRCHFRDSLNRTKAIGFVNDIRPETKVADGQWHTLRCERTATGVKATINYGEPNAISKFIKGTIGTINNKRPLSLGGKRDCDGGALNGGTVTCDYFAGAVDWVTIEKP